MLAGLEWATDQVNGAVSGVVVQSSLPGNE
jgi:hypothetical protein